jgi:hypothetical protein
MITKCQPIMHVVRFRADDGECFSTQQSELLSGHSAEMHFGLTICISLLVGILINGTAVFFSSTVQAD